MQNKNFVYVLNYLKIFKELPPKKSMDILTAAKKKKKKNYYNTAPNFKVSTPMRLQRQ